MNLYYDHTEDRKGSKLPKTIIEQGQKVIGLEAMTGADILITPLAEPKLPARLKPKSRPHKNKLKKLCEPGALIQRATGRDMLNHIRNASHILARMLEWTDCAVLLSIGNYGRGRDGMVSFQGKPTRWKYSSLQGAILSWQAGGGVYVNLAHGGALNEWLHLMHGTLVDIQAAPDKQLFTRLPLRPMRKADEIVDGYPMGQAIHFLSGLAGIGEKRAKQLLDEFGTAGIALVILTSEIAIADHLLPKGIGPKTLDSIKRVVGGSLELPGMWEPGFPVTVTFPPGMKVNTVGKRDRGWLKLEDGSIQATFFTAEQLRHAIPGTAPDQAQFETMLDSLVPGRRWGEKRLTHIAGEAVTAVRDIRTGRWTVYSAGRRWWWNGEKWQDTEEKV